NKVKSKNTTLNTSPKKTSDQILKALKNMKIMSTLGKSDGIKSISGTTMKLGKTCKKELAATLYSKIVKIKAHMMELGIQLIPMVLITLKQGNIILFQLIQ